MLKMVYVYIFCIYICILISRQLAQHTRRARLCLGFLLYPRQIGGIDRFTFFELRGEPQRALTERFIGIYESDKLVGFSRPGQGSAEEYQGKIYCTQVHLLSFSSFAKA